MANWLLFVLTLVASLLYFADFMFGRLANERARDALIKLYLIASEESWLPIYQKPAAALASFLSTKLKLGRGWWRFATAVGMYSALLTAVACLVAVVQWNAFSLADMPSAFIRFFGATIVPNILGDMLSWISIYHALKFVSRARPLSTIIVVVATMGVVVTAAATAMAVAFYISFLPIIFADVWKAVGILQLLSTVFVGTFTLILDTVPRIVWSILTFNDPNLMWLNYVQFILFLLPLSMFGCLVGLLLISSTSQPIFKTPLLTLIDRLEAAPKGILTTIALFITALAALLAALLKALG